MKRKIFSLILALMVCVSMAFSTVEPVMAASAHTACEHNRPPIVVEENLGYGHNSTHHWTWKRYVVTCRDCDYLLEVKYEDGVKELHKRYIGDTACQVCGRE